MHRLMGVLTFVVAVVALGGAAFADETAAGASTERKAVLGLLDQVQESFKAGDAKGLASCWTEGGEFVGPEGARIDGRKNIENRFQEAMAGRKGASLQMHITDFHVVNEALALVEADVEVKPAMATGGSPVVNLVLVKQDGRWKIESAREKMVYMPQQVNHLKELEWLVGNWTSETSKTGIALHTSCDWTVNQSYLIRKFKVEGKEAFLHGGTEVIAWDPRTRRIRSWVFDSDGGFGENVWVRDGSRWLIKYSGTLADGSEASATQTLTTDGPTRYSMQSTDRVVNGTAQPDIPAIWLQRVAEAKPAAKADEVPKTPEKAGP